MTSGRVEVETNVIDVSGDLFFIRTDYNRQLVMAIKKSLDGRDWKPEYQAWIAPVTPNNAGAVKELVESYGLRLTPAANGKILDLERKLIENMRLSRDTTGDGFEVSGLNLELNDFQKTGILYALKNKRTWIADQMRVRKTAQAIGLMHIIDGVAVVVCPATLKIMWERAIREWTPKRNPVILNGKKPDYSGDTFIINYDVLKKHQEALIAKQPRIVILDESHYCKDNKSQRTIAAEKISAGAEYVILLTGTPIMIRPYSLIAQLQIMRRLDDFGGFWNFTREYCDAHQIEVWTKDKQTGKPKKIKVWDFDGHSNLDRLMEKLRSICMIRRLRTDVSTEVPTKERAIIPLEISNRKEYDKAEAEIIPWLRNNARLTKKFYRSIEGLPEKERKEKIREYRASKAYKASKAEAMVKLSTLRYLTSKGKIESVCEVIQGMIDAGQKLICFAHYEDTIDHLQAKFQDSATAKPITGKVSKMEDRQAAVDQFQESESCRVIFISTRAGGAGLTLTAATDEIFIDLDFNPGIMDQAEDRAMELFNKGKTVGIYYLLGAGTVDEAHHEVIINRRGVSSMAVDGIASAEILETETIESLIEKLMGDENEN